MRDDRRARLAEASEASLAERRGRRPAYPERGGIAGGGFGRVSWPLLRAWPCSLNFFSSAASDSPGMAGVFPYRGPGNPVPGPLAPLPDYMSEEKPQEKGEEKRAVEAPGGGCASARARSGF